MKKKRLLSLIMACAIIFSIPVTAYASGINYKAGFSGVTPTKKKNKDIHFYQTTNGIDAKYGLRMYVAKVLKDDFNNGMRYRPVPESVAALMITNGSFSGAKNEIIAYRPEGLMLFDSSKTIITAVRPNPSNQAEKIANLFHTMIMKSNYTGDFDSQLMDSMNAVYWQPYVSKDTVKDLFDDDAWNRMVGNDGYFASLGITGGTGWDQAKFSNRQGFKPLDIDNDTIKEFNQSRMAVWLLAYYSTLIGGAKDIELDKLSAELWLGGGDYYYIVMLENMYQLNTSIDEYRWKFVWFTWRNVMALLVPEYMGLNVNKLIYPDTRLTIEQITKEIPGYKFRNINNGDLKSYGSDSTKNDWAGGDLAGYQREIWRRFYTDQLSYFSARARDFQYSRGPAEITDKNGELKRIWVPEFEKTSNRDIDGIDGLHESSWGFMMLLCGITLDTDTNYKPEDLNHTLTTVETSQHITKPANLSTTQFISLDIKEYTKTEEERERLLDGVTDAILLKYQEFLDERTVPYRKETMSENDRMYFYFDAVPYTITPTASDEEFQPNMTTKNGGSEGTSISATWNVPKKIKIPVSSVSYEIREGYHGEPPTEVYVHQLLPADSIREDIRAEVERFFSDKTTFEASKAAKWLHKMSTGEWDFKSTAQANYIFSLRANDRIEGEVDLKESEATFIYNYNDDADFWYWNNIQVAFGEVKEGTYSDNRSTETFDAMSGTPTTRTLYVNAGGTLAQCHIRAEKQTFDRKATFEGIYSQICEGHKVRNDDGDGYHTEYEDSHRFTDVKYTEATIGGEWLKITEFTVDPVDEVQFKNKDIFKEEIINFPSLDMVTITELEKVINDKAYIEEKDGTKIFSDKNYTKTLDGTCENSSSATKAYNIASEPYLKLVAPRNYYSIKIEDNSGQSSTLSVGGKVIENTSKSNQVSAPPITTKDFQPIANGWDPYTKVPLKGYLGNPALSKRNQSGHLAYEDGIEPVLHQLNGEYSFEPYKEDNYISYRTDGGVSYRPDRISTPSAEDLKLEMKYLREVVDDEGHENSISLLTENGNNVVADTVNSVVFHNPVSAERYWVHDVPVSELQDQRTVAGTFNKYIATNPRGYLDYALKITIANQGPFKIAYNALKGEDKKGRYDTIVRVGPGYTGVHDATFLTAPFSANIPSLDPTKEFMDTAEWINAKYIRFDKASVVYKDETGAMKHFPKNTWIELYNQNRGVNFSDAETFEFIISPETLDQKDVRVEILVEAMNTPEAIAQIADVNLRCEQLQSLAEQNVNITREVGENAAKHIAKNQKTMDVIGRIGNVVVDDTNDPAYNKVFWSGGVPGSSSGYYFGMPYNIYDQLLNSSTNYNDRFSALQDYHRIALRAGTLPVLRGNKNSKELGEMIKLGYNVQYSVQTIGSYDNGLTIYPMYQLAGAFSDTNKPFKLYTQEVSSGKLINKEYYLSTVKAGENYTAEIKVPYYHSLANSRAKINNDEKDYPSYSTITDRTKQYFEGYPHKIVVPLELRTYIGSLASKGNHGLSMDDNINYPSYVKEQITKAAQRYHVKSFLPSDTMILIQGKTSFEKRKPGQYIIEYASIRADSTTAPWSITTVTNTTSNGYPEGVPSIPGTPTSPGVPTVPEYKEPVTPNKLIPKVPVIVIDYSSPSNTDVTIEGTN